MNNTTATCLAQLRDMKLGWDKILTGVVLYGITLTTIFGNILVLFAVKVDKKLRTKFNYYLVNLAITDIAVAVTAMSFMATHTVLGCWPFREKLCAIWIFFDYGMTFVSVFTLILISFDRFWSVKWCVHYRKHHTRKKCIILIVVVWLFMLLLWLPPWLMDRLRHSKPGVCFWDPSKNIELVFIVATLGHHGPFLIMIYFYTHVFLFMRKRSRVINPSIRIGRSTDVGVLPSSSRLERSSINAPSELNDVHVNADPDPSTARGIFTTYSLTCNMESIGNEIMPLPRESRYARDRRVFITLTYIMIGYAILWLPFHIVFDITIAKPELVPVPVWHLAFWMTYFNSTINPFLYCFSSDEFRKTFKRMLCCNVS